MRDRLRGGNRLGQVLLGLRELELDLGRLGLGLRLGRLRLGRDMLLLLLNGQTLVVSGMIGGESPVLGMDERREVHDGSEWKKRDEQGCRLSE